MHKSTKKLKKFVRESVVCALISKYKLSNNTNGEQFSIIIEEVVFIDRLSFVVAYDFISMGQPYLTSFAPAGAASAAPNPSIY